MDKLVKISIVVGSLLAGIGVFYHFVIYLPGVELRKAERETADRDQAARRVEQEKLEVAMKEAARQRAYDECNRFARVNYEANWAQACRTVARVRSSNFKNCLANPTITGNRYMGEKYCYATYGDAQVSANCTLPTSNADAVNKTYHDEQQRCIAEAKLF